MYAATGGPNMKWGDTDFKWGAGHHWSPLGRRSCSRMSIQSCYVCVLDVEMLWFWMC